MKYSPDLIPFDKFNEEEGTTELKIRNGNLYESPNNLIFFDEVIGATHFKLYRNFEFDLVFEQSRIDKGRREARVSLKDLSFPQSLVIILVWNENKLSLSVGNPGKSDLRTSDGQWAPTK